MIIYVTFVENLSLSPGFLSFDGKLSLYHRETARLQHVVVSTDVPSQRITYFGMTYELYGDIKLWSLSSGFGTFKQA